MVLYKPSVHLTLLVGQQAAFINPSVL